MRPITHFIIYCIVFGFVCVALVGAETCNSSVFPRNGNDTCQEADTILLNQQVDEYIYPTGDEDWFEVRVFFVNTISVTLDVPTGLDFDLYIYESCSASLPICSSDNYADQDEFCSFTSRIGYYYIKVKGYQNASSPTLPYYLEVRMGAVSPSPTPTRTPTPTNTPTNDSCEGAWPITLGSMETDFIETNGDVDWWKVDIPSGGELSAQLTVPSGLDFDLRIYDNCPSGNQVCVSSHSEGIDESCLIPVQAGLYYLKISGFGANGWSNTQPYNLRLDANTHTPTVTPTPSPTTVPPSSTPTTSPTSTNAPTFTPTLTPTLTPTATISTPTATPIPNDTCQQATEVILGANYSATISPPGDIDWYKVNVSNSGTLEVMMTVPPGVNYDLEIYANCGSSVPICFSNNLTGQAEHCSITAFPAYYYIKIFPHSNSDWSSSLTYIFQTRMGGETPTATPGTPVNTATNTPTSITPQPTATPSGTPPTPTAVPTVVDDTCRHAYEIPFGSDYRQVIDSSNDIDWIKVLIPSSGAVEFLLDVPDNLNYNLAIFESCQASTPLCYSGNAIGQDELCIFDASADYYYANVFGQSARDFDINEEYVLSVNFAAPSATPTETPTPTPAPNYPEPKVYLAGYVNTKVTYGQGGWLEIMAMAVSPQHELVEKIEVFMGGIPTGLTLPIQTQNPTGSTFWLKRMRIEAGVPSSRHILELLATDENGDQSRLWPYLNVVP